MSHTQSTTNYKLPQFIATDEPTWLGDFNESMTTIDNNLSSLSTNIAAQDTKIKAAIDTANAAKESAESVSTTLSTEYSTSAVISQKYVAKTDLSQYFTKSESDARYELKGGSDFVLACIGDSFLDGYAPSGSSTSWGTLVANKLGCTPHNYSYGGVGFSQTISGKNISTLLQDAYNELGSNVDMIIIGAGINDRAKSQTDLYNAAFSTFTKARELFPDADIWVFPMLWGSKGYNVNVEELANRICFAANKVGNTTKPIYYQTGCWTWLYRRFTDVDNDYIHPLASGQRMIANNMLDVIAGGDPTIRFWFVQGAEANTVWMLNYLTLTLQCAGCSYSNDDYFASYPDGLKPYSCIGQFLMGDGNGTEIATAINGTTGVYVWQGTKTGTNGYCTLVSMLGDSI